MPAIFNPLSSTFRALGLLRGERIGSFGLFDVPGHLFAGRKPDARL
jgi:hypothetical protein